MRVKPVILFLVIAIGIIGCAPRSMYSWGNYETKLYKYYKNPAEVENMTESLAKIIARGEVDNRVPPGIYAEYGYLRFITGNSGEAITYFKKEKMRWPESSMLMDKMIVSATKDINKRSKHDNSKTTVAVGGATQ